MADKSFTKIKSQIPISVIVHATNLVGFTLAKTLLEQGSKVILIDTFNSESKKLITELKKLGNVDFVDIKGLEDLTENIGRVDYLFYIQSEFLLKTRTFTSKDFLEESNNLNLSLKVSQKYNAKFSLISTMYFNEKLAYSMQNVNYSQPTPYSAEELQKYSETLVAEDHDKSKINARILRLGALLGKENNLEYYETLRELFEDSINKTTINIKGEGLDIHYLVNLTDAIYGILKLTFSPKTNGEVVSLCNNNDYTTLSIAYKLLELNPNATEIKFVSEPEKSFILHSQYIPAPNAEVYSWVQKKSLEESIAETLEAEYLDHNKKWDAKPTVDKTYQEKLEEIRKRQEAEEEKEKKKTATVRTPLGEFIEKIIAPLKNLSEKSKEKGEKKLDKMQILKYSLASVGLILLFVFLISPLISIGIGSFLIYQRSEKITQNVYALELDKTKDDLDFVGKNITNINSNFERLKWIFTITGQKEIFTNTSQLIYATQNAIDGTREIAVGAEPLVTYIKDFEPALDFQNELPATTREYTSLLKQLEANSGQIQSATYKLSLATNLIEDVDTSVYPQAIQKYIEEIKKYNSAIKDSINPVQNVIAFLPNLLGVDERQRYLILLQNQGELRSTGGWISSYAILGLEGGQIRELVVDDVYNLDGELKNKQLIFSAPVDMQNALGIKDWNLSLSNWDPDFPETANNAEFFVKQSGKTPEIDGVITLDVQFLQNLLEKWGGIKVPGEEEVVTKDNIHDKIFAMHEAFTPGESQKATFLANLSNEVIKKILSSDASGYKDIAEVIMKSLDQKDILVYIKDPKAQRYFAQEGWNGEINSKYLSSPFSVEWNWGGNKANLFLKRNQKITMDIVNYNDIKGTYSLFLQNNSVSSTYPQGEYTNYVRVYLPETAELQSVKGFLDSKYVTTYKDGYKIVSGWFNVPIKTTKQLEIKYEITKAEELGLINVDGNTINMPLNLYKQPGTGNDEVRVEITYPQNWSVIDTAGFSKSTLQLVQQTELDTEKNYNLKWEIK